MPKCELARHGLAGTICVAIQAKIDKTRCNIALANLELDSFRYDKAEILSRGLLQRLAIARALIHSPAVLLADEPFTGLDSSSCQHLVSVLNSFKADDGTVIMTTHDLNMAMKCCDRIVVLDKTQLIFNAKINDIDKTSFLQDYLLYARDN